MRIRWKDFELPTGVSYDTESMTDTYGKFWIKPFERGFGSTMGNSLRRVLLSSIEGSAPTAIRIDGIRSEFENLDGVYEDTTEIVMNVKGLFVKVSSDEPLILRIEKQGPGEVRASDIQEHQDVEIMNPDHLIATLTGDVNFSMELEVRRGRGFVLARENMDIAKPSNVEAFSVDSIYSPIQRVNHKILGDRVGQKTDYENLQIEIWTNGVVTPKEAINEAASILRKHITPFLSFNTAESVAPAETETLDSDEPLEMQTEENLKLPISVLNPSKRTSNCLSQEGITTLGQLVALSEHEMLKFRNFGQTSLNEIKEKLKDFDLEIGQGKR